MISKYKIQIGKVHNFVYEHKNVVCSVACYVKKAVCFYMIVLFAEELVNINFLLHTKRKHYVEFEQCLFLKCNDP